MIRLFHWSSSEGINTKGQDLVTAIGTESPGPEWTEATIHTQLGAMGVRLFYQLLPREDAEKVMAASWATRVTPDRRGMV